jgi:glycerol-3-phosphate dehydrogenase
VEPDRLTLAWAIAADEHGAVLGNYVEAQSLIRDNGRVGEVRAVGRHRPGEMEIEARVTVNATGGRVDRLLEEPGLTTALPLLEAINVVTMRPAGGPAVGGLSPAGRHLFRVPWMGRAVFGTWESSRAVQAAGAGPPDSEVSSFVEELNRTFPGLALSRAEVTLVHHGLVPAARPASGRVALEKHEQITDHAERHGTAGLISVAVTKYTTARAVAARVVDRVFAHLGRPLEPSRTDASPLPGARAVDPHARSESSDLEAALPDDVRAHLVAAHGNRRGQVLDLAAGHPALMRRLTGSSPVIAAELVHAVRHEMAVHLTDVVLRRTPLGALGFPGDDVVAAAAAVVGDELGWSHERRREEAEAVGRFYVTA